MEHGARSGGRTRAGYVLNVLPLPLGYSSVVPHPRIELGFTPYQGVAITIILMGHGVQGGSRTHTVYFLRVAPPNQLGYLDMVESVGLEPQAHVGVKALT